MRDDDRAIELFFSADKCDAEARSKMAEIITRGLKRKVATVLEEYAKDGPDVVQETLDLIAEKLGIEAKELTAIYEGKFPPSEIKYELFDRLELPLDLSIHDVLGKPDLRDPKKRERWAKRCRTEPMFRAAALAGSTPVGNDAGKTDRSLSELEIFVTLRAIRELRSI